MMAYLDEVESQVSGNEIKYIREMISYSRETMGNHMLGYDKIKQGIEGMGEEAIESLKQASKYDTEAKKLVVIAQKGSDNLKSDLVAIREESPEKKKNEPQGMRLGAQGGAGNVPLQKQKADIVN